MTLAVLAEATPAEIRAFRRQIDSTLRELRRLSDETIRAMWSTIERTRLEVLDELARQLGEDNLATAAHLRNVQDALEAKIGELSRIVSVEMSDLLERADELGVEMVDAAMGKLGVPIIDQIVSTTVLGVVAQASADLIANVSSKALAAINQTLATSALGGLSPFEAIQRIARALPDRSTFSTLGHRAEAIFRTEANRMFAIAGQARMEQAHKRLPGLQKTWLTAGDARVRADHAATGGQIRDVDATYDVAGYSARFPRDATLPASEVVNCRCQSIPYIGPGSVLNPTAEPSATDTPGSETPLGSDEQPPVAVDGPAEDLVSAAKGPIERISGQTSRWDGRRIGSTNSALGETGWSGDIAINPELWPTRGGMSGSTGGIGDIGWLSGSYADQLSAAELNGVRWQTIIHEMAHTISTSIDDAARYRALKPFEESVVEMWSRTHRGEILAELRIDAALLDFASIDASNGYNAWNASLELIRGQLGWTREEFYDQLIATPLAQRVGVLDEWVTDMPDGESKRIARKYLDKIEDWRHPGRHP